MLRLLRFLKPYLLLIVFLFVMIAVQVWSGLQLPALLAKIVNDGIMQQDTDYIWTASWSMLGYAALSSVCALITALLSGRIGAAFARDVRAAFFKQVLSFSIPDISDFSTASLITRATQDINTVQESIVMCFSMMLRAPMTCVIAIGQAIATAPDMTWIIALAVGLIFFFVITIMSVVMPKFRILQKIADQITLLTRENLTGLRVIRAFNNQEYERKKFQKTNHENARLNIWVDTILSLNDPLISLVMNGVMLLCIYIGITLISKDFAYLGNMMAFMSYALQVVMSFLFLTMLFVILPRANVSSKRINEVIDRFSKIKWRHDTIGRPKYPPSVEFKHVDFAYEGADEKVLSDVSFKAESGQTTAFIGSTGSGKSTLINLVPRFYEATAGEILINGLDIKNYAEKDLMQRIGYVPQKGVLFSGTVRDNILFGLDTDSHTKLSFKDKASYDERMHLAARISQSASFIEKMDGKYNAKIARGGTNVSGGQKQRLSIARAIAKDPQIYIFDDSFSALDMKTDRKLRESLKEVTGNAVVLIVAQRINTIKEAEQIVVLDKGTVVGKGTHLELLKKCKVYREITKSQFSEKEFATELRAAGIESKEKTQKGNK